MEQKVLDFIKNNRVSVLAVLLKDGTPHVSTVHFSHKENPLTFFIFTDKSYRKCGALLNGEIGKASLVIGFSEEEMLTLQIDGTIQLVTDDVEFKEIKALHFNKITTAKEYENDPGSVFLKFIPTWWRYTDYNTEPQSILSSE